MSGSERIVQQSVLRPSVLNHGLASQSLDFGFTPIATVSPPNQFIPQAVRPVPTNSGIIIAWDIFRQYSSYNCSNLYFDGVLPWLR